MAKLGRSKGKKLDGSKEETGRSIEIKLLNKGSNNL